MQRALLESRVAIPFVRREREREEAAAAAAAEGAP